MDAKKICEKLIAEKYEELYNEFGCDLTCILQGLINEFGQNPENSSVAEEASSKIEEYCNYSSEKYNDEVYPLDEEEFEAYISKQYSRNMRSGVMDEMDYQNRLAREAWEDDED